MSKILSIDIETRPALVYTWGVYDVNIGYEQIVEPGGIICFAAKWVGEKAKNTVFYSEWTHSRYEMLKAARDLLNEADAVLSFNGIKFDLPKLNGEFVLEGLTPAGPVTHIDVLKTVRKFGLIMNKLAFVGPLLGVGEKIKHEGFSLWVKVMAGDPKAQNKMRKYNIQDVVLLEKLYNRIKPFIVDHPHLGDEAHECGSCGSDHLQKRGYRRSKYFKTERLQCVSCGAWQTGKREKIG